MIVFWGSARRNEDQGYRMFTLSQAEFRIHGSQKLLLMAYILHYLEDPELWESRNIPYYGRIYLINRSVRGFSGANIECLDLFGGLKAAMPLPITSPLYERNIWTVWQFLCSLYLAFQKPSSSSSLQGVYQMLICMVPNNADASGYHVSSNAESYTLNSKPCFLRPKPCTS